MKLSKKNIIHLCVLTGIYLLFVLALTRFKYAYGSELDWGGQHYALLQNRGLFSLLCPEHRLW